MILSQEKLRSIPSKKEENNRRIFYPQARDDCFVFSAELFYTVQNKLVTL